MAATPTPGNPTGVASFDLSELARLDGFQALAATLDGMTRTLAASDARLDQEAWLRAVADIASALPFADCCDRCSTLTYPGTVEVGEPDGGGGSMLQASYWCPPCGHGWTCSWGTSTAGD